MSLKKILRLCGAATLLCLAALFTSNKLISDAAAGKLYETTDLVPAHKVGLLLGTGRLTANGKLNPFYSNRIMAATALLRSGKIRYLIISGDNSRIGYNEPEDMRRDLISNGIDSSVIFLDYAGFRTFDSMKRLKTIFGQDTVTVISQQFHNERALYIASRLGITAAGFNAKDVSRRAGASTWIREKFARAKVFLDFWFGKEPRFAGPKVIIPS